MALTIDHLFDLIDQLHVGFTFNPASSGSTVLELQSIDRASKSVTISNKKFTESAFNRIVDKVNEKVPIAFTSVNEETGSNRAYLVNLLCYTTEFYYSKVGKAHLVWIPSDPHPVKTQGVLTKAQLDAKCGTNQAVLENLILYGPPGTGKTYSTKERAITIIDGRCDPLTKDTVFKNYVDSERIVVVTFHQSYSYEDFVEGIKVDVSSGTPVYEPKPGVFQLLCQNAKKSYDANPNNPDKYVLIIDEINRGNISKVFGELITLIEPSKRIGETDELFVTLPYSSSRFGVPKNLYIIGTMNSADKSISVIDSALRRRFRFIDYEPNSKKLTVIGKGKERVDLGKMLDMINRRITALLDKDHTIGHTYFMKVDTLPKLALVFRDEVIPLLQEIFFNNMQAVRLVLNGGEGFTKRSDEQFFVEDPQYKHKELFGKALEEYDQKDVYVLNSCFADDKVKSIKAAIFKHIYEKS